MIPLKGGSIIMPITLREEISDAISKMPADMSGLRIMFTPPRYDGDILYVSCEGTFYSLRYVDEKGGNSVNCETEDYNEIKYACFEKIVSHAASVNLRQHAVQFQDQRRVRFSLELEYMKLLDPICYSMHQKEIDAILKENPYDDELSYKLNCLDVCYKLLPKYTKYLKRQDKKSAKKVIDTLLSIRRGGTDHLDEVVKDTLQVTDRIYPQIRDKLSPEEEATCRLLFEKAKEYSII